MPSEIEAVLVLLSGILDALQIEYAIGGSIASSIHGIPRSTQSVRALPFVKL